MDRSPGHCKLVLVTCALMLASFAALAWRGFVHESPTVDEPLHAVAAYRATFERDFRMNTEDPPLWKYWMMIPHRRGELSGAADASEFDPASGGFFISTRQLFQSPGIDGDAFIHSSRFMMLVIGVLLGAAIMRWSHQLAGGVAAIIAGVLYCFEPGFLGHAPLLKNDVFISLFFVCIAWTTWRVGKNGNAWNIAAIVVLSGFAATVKFSGLLAAPAVLAMLACRALAREPWQLSGIKLQTRAARFAGAALIWITCGLFAWAAIWASYGFRFTASTDSRFPLNFDAEYRQIAINRQIARSADAPMPGLPEEIVRFSHQHRLAPESWLFGILHTYGSSLVRQSFLLGENSATGWWYYFPLAFLFKTPLATLAVTLLAAGLLVAMRRHASQSADRWSILCVGIPMLIYGWSALSTNLNLGVRHLLPMYALLFVSIGAVISRVWRIVPRPAFRLLIGAGVAALAVESLVAFPNHISFFNVIARPNRLGLLSDSNFDWGQDLKRVAEWQKKNPNEKLYLGYWGPADPTFYEIRYTNIPGGFAMGRAGEMPDNLQEPGVLMISATLLQGVNFPPQTRDFYAALRDRRPDQLIGDTIYLYKWPPR
jgi:hypothetical protein